MFILWFARLIHGAAQFFISYLSSWRLPKSETSSYLSSDAAVLELLFGD